MRSFCGGGRWPEDSWNSLWWLAFAGSAPVLDLRRKQGRPDPAFEVLTGGAAEGGLPPGHRHAPAAQRLHWPGSPPAPSRTSWTRMPDADPSRSILTDQDDEVARKSLKERLKDLQAQIVFLSVSGAETYSRAEIDAAIDDAK